MEAHLDGWVQTTVGPCDNYGYYWQLQCGGGAILQSCYLLWALDAAYHKNLVSGLTILIYWLKQDTWRFSLYIHVPAGELVEWLQRYGATLCHSTSESWAVRARLITVHWPVS